MPRKTQPYEEPITEPVEPAAIEPPLEDDSTITFKRSHFFSALSIITFLMGLLLGYILWGTGLLPRLGTNASTTALVNSPVEEAPVTQQPKYTRYDIPTDGSYTLGPKDAPITLVEFSDYQCPYCKKWHQEVYKDLLAAYPGKIRFVYRNLPLTSIHPDSFAAAEAAMCAGDQNVYWQYHDKLFNGSSLGTNVYIQYARDLHLDISTFQTCFTQNKHKDTIQADSNFAINLGISSTPTFFINGLAVVGAQPLGVFKQVIDKELAGEIPK